MPFFVTHYPNAMRSVFPTLYLLLFCLSASAQIPALIPKPVSVALNFAERKFILSDNTTVLISDPALKLSADFLADYLLRYYRIVVHTLPYAGNEKKTNAILLIRTVGANTNPGEYQLNAGAKQIEISAAMDEGIFYGIQTLTQLLPIKPAAARQLDIAAIQINDYPPLRLSRNAS